MASTESEQVRDPWAPVPVADIIDSPVEGRFQSARSGTGGWDDITIHQPGATFIKLHFDRLDLAAGEILWLLDAQGEFVQRITAADEGTWSSSVGGDVALLRLESPDIGSSAGFSVDQLAVGTVPILGEADDDPEVLDAQFRSVCGSDNRKRAACYGGSIFNSAKTVARLLFPKNGNFYVCTGALISADSHFITNNHCINTQSLVNNTEFLFNYQKVSCTGTANASTQSINGGTFIRTSAGLDYTLVHLPGNPAATYGHLQIASSPVSVGTTIYIPQHPGGRQKEIGVHDDDGNCDVKATNTSPGGYTTGSNIGYLCDTEGGSSGSPVIRASDHKMIALHHLGGCNNQGTKMQNIYPEIASDLSAGPPVDPFSCVGKCGQVTGSCSCEEECEDNDYGDQYECCPNKVAVCG